MTSREANLRSLSPGKFNGLRRMADADGRFKMLAVDQTAPIEDHCRIALDEDKARVDDVREIKRLLIETLSPRASAVLVEPVHSLMEALIILAPAHGLIVALEDSHIAEVAGGRMSKEAPDWSVSKIRRLGGDAVKALTWFRPDQDPASLNNQREFAKRVGDACAEYDIPFLLQLATYPLPSDGAKISEDGDLASRRCDHVLSTVEEFAKPDYGVDVFKLESPMPAMNVAKPGEDSFDTCQALFREVDRLAGRPWVMLSDGADQAAFRIILRHAFEAGASGYLAGRAIWWDEFRNFPDMRAMAAGLRANSAAYMGELNAMTDSAARPWTNWYYPAYPTGMDAPNFPSIYADCNGNI